MEYLDTILGAAVAWLAYRAGMRREQKRTARKTAICGCEHHRSFHKDDGVCEFKVGFDRNRCGCQKYLGPITYQEFMAEELEGA